MNKLLEYQSYFFSLCHFFFQNPYLRNLKTQVLQTKNNLAIWKCKHLVKYRTYFEYVRNTAIILEANQLPNLSLKCQSETIHTNINLFCFLSLVFQIFLSGQIPSYCVFSFSNASKTNSKPLLLRQCSQVQSGRLHNKANLL